MQTATVSKCWSLAGLLALQCSSASKLVCYFTNWAQYRSGKGSFLPDHIDPHLCTHLIYAFASMSDNEITTVEWDDVTLYEAFTGLKGRNQNLKTLLSIGGSSMGTDSFSHMASSADNRRTFVRSVVQFLQTHEFDGLDVAWIYPGRKDKRHFTSLIQELAKAFEKEARKTGKEKLLLSAAVSAGRINIDTGYEVDKISKSVDFINLMTYDFHGASWEKTTRHVSPLSKGKKDLRTAGYNNVDNAVRYWKKKGAPGEKIIMGIPTYGRSFTLDTMDTGVGAPASKAGLPGPFTSQAGLLAYYEICTFKQGATTEMIEEQKVPYSYKGNQWVGYDDTESIKTKVKHLKHHALGGAMVWTIDMDDFSGSFCHQGAYPLIQTLKRELNPGRQ